MICTETQIGAHHSTPLSDVFDFATKMKRSGAPFRVTSKGLGLRRVREIRAWEMESKESGFAAQKSTANTVDLR